MPHTSLRIDIEVHFYRVNSRGRLERVTELPYIANGPRGEWFVIDMSVNGDDTTRLCYWLSAGESFGP